MINQTKQILEESLKKLMLQKPLDKITIRDLTEDCGISRMAFYYHFKDIYDLVEWSCLEDAPRAHAGKKTYDTWSEGLVQIFAEVSFTIDKSVSFIADFYKYSFVGLMLDWIKQGMKDDYVDLAHKISITIHGSLTHSIENFAALPKKENS